MSQLEVSIVQNDCTSCGLCPEIAPTYFFMGADNLAYVKDNDSADPVEPTFKDFDGKVVIADGLENKVIEAAEECPGACIYVEPVGVTLGV